jgi:tetratricopeptide (TPR) repeat protein
MNSIKKLFKICNDNRSGTVKPKVILGLFCLITMMIGCSKNVTFTPEHIAQTSGRYLYNQDEVIDVYYDHNTLFLKWKGAEKIEPVALDAHTFFVADMYKKLRFVQHPETKKWYLGVVSKDDDTKVTYDYLKVADTFKTPYMYLKAKAYDKALEGYLELKKQDSTRVGIEEREVNRLGYNLLRIKEYENAIAVFKMNVALYPDSDNVYDSLADAYLRSGDSLQAFTHYSKALELNTGNDHAKRYVELYSKSHN